MSTKYKVTAKGRIAPNGYRLCDPLKINERLVSSDKTEYIVGKPIGAGGFGEVYTCHKKNDTTNEYVMKVDNREGPLFVEVHFMTRVCKDTIIQNYIRKRQIDFLGIPKVIGFGNDSAKKIRFLVLDRFGDELNAILNRTRLPIETVCRITCRIIDALEFIHENGYIHADIKAANILRRRLPDNGAKRNQKRPSTDNADITDDHYYLIDFGLAERFLFDNVHKPYEEDERRVNNGTREFRSRDAHIGVISRRSDMESLGWNLIIWLYGRHPWEPLLKCDDAVYEKKCWAINNIQQCLEESFSDSPLPEFKVENKASSKRGRKQANEKVDFEMPQRTFKINTRIPKGLDKYLYAVEKMEFDERPNYVALKEIVMDIARLNPPSDDDNDLSPEKKPKLTAGSRAAKTRGAKGAATKSSSELLEHEIEPEPTVKSNGRTRRAVNSVNSTASSSLAAPAKPTKTVRQRSAAKLKAEPKNEDILGDSINDSVDSNISEVNINKKTNGHDHHETKPSTTTTNGRPKRGQAAVAAQASSQQTANNSSHNNSEPNSPERPIDKHASMNGKNSADYGRTAIADLIDSAVGSPPASGGRFSKRPRTSTYLHEVSISTRMLRRSLVEQPSDNDNSDDDDDRVRSFASRRIYVGNNLSASKRSNIADEHLTSGTNNQQRSSPIKRPRNGSFDDDSSKQFSSKDDSDKYDGATDEDDDDDTVDHSNCKDDDDEDEMPFGVRSSKSDQNRIYPLAAKNGRANTRTATAPGRRYETSQMIKIRQKLEMKKASAAKAAAAAASGENGSAFNGKTNGKAASATNGTRNGT